MAQRVTAYNGPERRASNSDVVELKGRLDGHEDVCSERYRNLERRLDEQKVAVDRLYSTAWWIAGTLIAAMAGGFGTLFLKIAESGKHLVN